MKPKLDRGNPTTRGVTRALFWLENLPRVLLHPLAASWQMSEAVVLQGVNTPSHLVKVMRFAPDESFVNERFNTSRFDQNNAV